MIFFVYLFIYLFIYFAFLLFFNPFSTNVRLIYPLKTLENLRFSDVFREYRSGTLFEDGLMKLELCL